MKKIQIRKETEEKNQDWRRALILKGPKHPIQQSKKQNKMTQQQILFSWKILAHKDNW
jgi:hypothetical protein